MQKNNTLKLLKTDSLNKKINSKNIFVTHKLGNAGHVRERQQQVAFVVVGVHGRGEPAAVGCQRAGHRVIPNKNVIVDNKRLRLRT